MTIRIYTDGSFHAVTHKGASAFIAVDDSGKEIHRDKVSKLYVDSMESEIFAMFMAATWIRNLEEKPKRVEIYSDSKGLVENLNVHSKKWEKKAVFTKGVWTSTNGQPVVHQETYKQILQLLRESGVEVRIIHIRNVGHTNNEIVDKFVGEI